MAPQDSTSTSKPPEQSASEPGSNGTDVSSVKAREEADYQVRNSKLEHQIREIQNKQQEVDAQLKTKDPQALVNDHIRRLHQYNEIRDIGQGLMGMIAEQRGVRVVDVYKDFDIGDGD